MMTLRATLFLAAATGALAQDTRVVTEPKFPAACAPLDARLTPVDSGKTIAEADETKLDTVRIQRAIDECAKGQAVVLRATGGKSAFLSGPLRLRAGVTLRVDAGATLFGSRDPRVYDVAPGACGVVDKSGRGCRPLISVEGAHDAAVMGEGAIDGRGWAKLLGQQISWWDLAEQARKGGNQNCPRLIVTNKSNNFTLYKITLKNSGQFHVVFGAGDGFTAWGVVIDTPKNARNTDGIDPSAASNVTITHCRISTGDDNVAIKAGGHVRNVTVSHNRFFRGHGMSIGSETYGGAEKILVEDLAIDGADNGLRIKSNSSRGGPVHDVLYRDVCIRNTKNPIYMDTDYSAVRGANTDRVPVFTNIVLRDVRVLSGQKITLEGIGAQHRLGMTFDNVHFDVPMKMAAKFGEFTLGPGPVNFRPEGEGVTVTGTPGQGTPNACAGKFSE